MEGLFDTKEKQEEAIAYLKQLKVSPAWTKVVVPFLENQITETQRRLQTIEFENLADVKKLQDRVISLQVLLDLPDDYIKHFRAAEGGAVNFDPYDESGETAQDTET